MKNHLSLATFSLAVLISVSFMDTTRAGLVLMFSIDGGNTFDDEFEMLSGAPTNLDVFLAETDGTTLLSDEGLSGFGLTGAFTPASVDSIANAEIDSIFNIPLEDNFDSTSFRWNAAAFDFSDPLFAPTGEKIRLGQLQLAPKADGVSELLFGDIQPGADSSTIQWLSGAGVELDEQIFGLGATNTFQVTLSSVSAVPEPGSLLTVALGVGVFAFRRRRSI